MPDLASIPMDAAEGLPLHFVIGVAVVLLLLVFPSVAYFGLFGTPRWVRAVARRWRRSTLGRWTYRPKRRVRRGRPNQLRPVRSVARVELEDDAVQLLPVGAPLALEAGPADVIENPPPWFAGREFQHRQEVSR